MRKLVLTLAALAAVGFALPVVSNSANAETVIIKKTHRDHGRHEGWRNHHHNRVVVREHRHYHHGARVGTTGVGVVVR